MLWTLVLPFLRDRPQVHVDIVTEGRLVDIVAGGFDLGVRTADLVPADMIALPLEVVRRNVVVATPAYLEERGTPLTPDDLAAPGTSFMNWSRFRGSLNLDTAASGARQPGASRRAAPRSGGVGMAR